jgi:RNA polymerase sigma-70 factor, ECF subfamily
MSHPQTSHSEASASKSAELDAGLLASLAGDEQAYRRFLDQLATVLSAYFRKRIFGSQDEVEDLIQETVLAVHRRRYTYRTDVPVLVWVYAIARHKHIDWLRAQGRKPESLHVEDEHSPSGDFIGEWQTARDVRLVLSRLPSAQAHLLAYNKLMGYSIEETAALMGMSEAAVKVGIHRGMKALSKLFGGVLHEA